MSERQAPKPTTNRTDGRQDGGTGWRDKLTPARLLVLVLAALSIVLIAENTRDVRIRLLVPVVTMPLYAALLIMFVLGALCGALLAYNRNRRK
jgi:uncharacterized integral membrane protein